MASSSVVPIPRFAAIFQIMFLLSSLVPKKCLAFYHHNCGRAARRVHLVHLRPTAGSTRRARFHNNTSRPFSGTLDSWDFDQQFGGFDYVPDEYDRQEMEREEHLWQNDNYKVAVESNSATELQNLDSSTQRPVRDQITSTELVALEAQLQTILLQLGELTKDPQFNPNSPRQVSLALYGEAGMSTNKDVLDAMAARGNPLAHQMLQFRRVHREVLTRKKRQESRENGTLAKSVYTVKRTGTFTTEAEPSQAVSAHPSPDQSPAAATFEDRTDPLLLVDASAYIFRAYYAFPPMHRSDGMPIGAVLGFCNMLNRLVLTTMMEGRQPRIVLVFDAPGKTFRQGLYPLYKANRPEAPVDLIPQFGLIREAAKAYGIAQLEAPSYEADDVIATLATMAVQEGIDCNILSGDKDLMQLITPSEDAPSIQMIDPMSMNRVSYEDVVEKWGVGPEKLGDVLALAGDSSDNIPGVPGIGPKIAADLIGAFGSLEGLLENVEQVKQKGRREKLQNNMEQARLSRVLVELERNVPMDQMTFPEGSDRVSDLRIAPMDAERLVQFFDDVGLRDLKRRFQNRLQIQQGIDVAPQKRPERSRFEERPKAQIPRPEDFADVPF